MVITSGSLYSPVCQHTKDQQQPSRGIITESGKGIMKLCISSKASLICAL